MATKDKEKELPVEEAKTPEATKEILVEEAKTSEPTKEDISKMQVLVVTKKDDEVKLVELSHTGYENMLQDIENCASSSVTLNSNWKGYRLATEDEVREFVKKNDVKRPFANKFIS